MDWDIVEFSKYMDKVWKFLDDIPHNSDYYYVDDLCKEENKELFVSLVKWYMVEHLDEYMGDLVFNEDYSRFYKAHKIIK